MRAESSPPQDDGSRARFAVGSLGCAALALAVSVLATRGTWRHGDEPRVAALLLLASLSAIVAVALAALSAKGGSARSFAVWMPLLLAIVAALATVRAWGVL